MTKSFGNIEDSDVPAQVHATLGEAIRSTRLNSGYSIEQVAVTCGLTEFEIAKIEAGRLVDERLVARISRALKIVPSSGRRQSGSVQNGNRRLRKPT
jgi:transcriptional regulator with XRE-family HTH domain